MELEKYNTLLRANKLCRIVEKIRTIRRIIRKMVNSALEIGPKKKISSDLPENVGLRDSALRCPKDRPENSFTRSARKKCFHRIVGMD